MKNRPVDGSPFMLRPALRIGHDSHNHHHRTQLAFVRLAVF